jgi:predicted dehydrogenase
MATRGTPVTRRELLTRAAALAAMPCIVPASVLVGGGAVAPSDRVALGFIGIGAMGQGHLGCCVRYPEARVLAVCDVDRWRRENAKVVVEEAYAAERAAATGGRVQVCTPYNDLRELLDRPDIDAVVIATGDRWHALATVMAAQAGKDIYCEKPISLTIREARAMVEAVRRYHRVLQCGLQQRSTAEFRKACELVRSGAIGDVRIVYVNHPGTNDDVSLPAEPVPDGLDWDLWLGPAPWRPYNGRFHIYGRPPRVVPWDFCRDFGGGNLTSNAVHAFDVAQWGLGMDDSGPVEITPPGRGPSLPRAITETPAGGYPEQGPPPALTYRYASGVLLQVVPGYLPRPRLFELQGWDERTPVQSFGAVFVGERGWIHVGREGYLQSQPSEIVRQARTSDSAARPVNNHHQNWFDSIRTRQRPACDVAVGARSTTVSHLGCIAHWLGRSLKWDPAREEFIGDEEANRLQWRPMRQPWTL